MPPREKFRVGSKISICMDESILHNAFINFAEFSEFLDVWILSPDERISK